ncbi:MAG: alpha-ketoacid dehydrogenase subunit beta [Sulfobacillus acidophilus]|uniref:Alpha-ketoacid dehydrogenase subunit beta n=1 Tax=Sulfobacillus acidophilus TaxID=53633 RepID=A0A2T2WND3_9FIRM|nr:MAG: alpha-ketoacid dehydrogenase subunit beta [Sulfobacillus acidophilus]
MAELTMAQAINQALMQTMAQDDTVILLGEDIGRNGGVFRVTKDLFEQFGEDRVVDTPLSESAILGSAVGLAMNGLHPVAEIQFLGFICSGFHQIITQAARLRSRSLGHFTVPLVIRAPYGGGIGAPELHSDSLETFFVHSPGLKVVVPSRPFDAKGLLFSAIADPDPVIFLEPMPLYRAFREEVPSEVYFEPLGKARVVHEGMNLTVIYWGSPGAWIIPTVLSVEKATGSTIEVIDVRTLSPLDEETIIASVTKTGRVLVVHEAVRTAGVGAEIISRIMAEAFYRMEAPPMRVCGYDTPYPVAQLEREWLPNSARVERTLRMLLEY